MGEPATRFRLRAQGLHLAMDRLRWTLNGHAFEEKLLDVVQVGLELSPATVDFYGVCTIMFKDGTVLTVLGGNRRGGSQRARAVLYRNFVSDLHHRLVQQGAGSIEFIAGAASQRLLIVGVAAVSVMLILAIPAAWRRQRRGRHTGFGRVKFELDENIGRRGLELLTAAGHDVMTVWNQDLHGISDEKLFEICAGRCASSRHPRS